jgi:hypothetical protein
MHSCFEAIKQAGAGEDNGAGTDAGEHRPGFVLRPQPTDLGVETISASVIRGHGEIRYAHDVGRRAFVDPAIGTDWCPVCGYQVESPGADDTRRHALLAQHPSGDEGPVTTRSRKQVVHGE